MKKRGGKKFTFEGFDGGEVPDKLEEDVVVDDIDSVTQQNLDDKYGLCHAFQDC